MDPITAFFITLSLLFVLTVATLVTVRRPLNDILIEICGAPHRARFWSRFFGAMLLLSVLFFCLCSPPDAGSRAITFREIIGMMRAGLLGLLTAMGLLAIVVLVWQSRFERGLAPARDRRAFGRAVANAGSAPVTPATSPGENAL